MRICNSLQPRHTVLAGISAASAMLLTALSSPVPAQVLPVEPLKIGTGPQFVFDNYVVDNHWAIKYKHEAVQRVFHAPTKHAGNPVIPGEGGYVCVLRDEESGLFRMWYQTWTPSPVKGRAGTYAIAYAESKDGVAWTLPMLNLYEWKGSRENNIVWRGVEGRRASAPCLLDLPEEDRRGYRYVMLYRETGIHLVGSQDGIHWDKTSDMEIAHLHSDTLNNLVYDPRRREYVFYCRAKHIYRTFRGSILDTGASRRVARMAGKKLWTLWETEPQTILIPDELDARDAFNFFYGMPVRIYGGVYFGFLWPFKMNTDIHTELAWSRDGIGFHRMPDRPKLIARGPDGAWDDGMVFGGLGWVEVGNEWWIYYGGWDGPHGTSERTPGIGLVKLRKEGFISMHGPERGGGVVATRKLVWPGGKLLINADAAEGELSVRVTDAKRKVLTGFDYEDCVAFQGDSVAHAVTWKEKSLDVLKGQIIRFEFFLKNADLYTFRALQEDTQ